MVATSSLKIMKIFKNKEQKKRKKICGEEFFTKKNFKKII